MSWGSVSFEATASTPWIAYDPRVFPIRFAPVRLIFGDLDRMMGAILRTRQRPQPHTVLLSQTQYARMVEFGSRR